MYITDQVDFEAFLSRAIKSDAVAIDTEFIRDTTYWPRLCLLQMAIKDEFVLVDPFSVDITSIRELLSNDTIMKVFHSPRQDIEILRHKTGVLPKPLFDTQVAAAFVGYTIQVGYGHLVHKELGVKLKKGDSFSDWSMRPLSKSQLRYAADDVTYLLDLYYKMSNELKDNDRLKWVFEDIDEKFLQVNIYDILPEERYKKLRRLNSLKPKQLSIALEVTAWREREAMKINTPRKWVLKDDEIIEICKKPADTINKLFSLRGLKQKLSMDQAREITEAVKKGLAKKEYPQINDTQECPYKVRDLTNSKIDSEVDLMCALIRLRAKQYKIAPQILSTNSDLNKIAHGCREGIDTLSGWRKNIVGNELIDLMEGKKALAIKDGKVEEICISQ